MKQANKNIKKLINAVKKNKHALNIGIQVGKKNAKIDYYCDNCQRLISHYHEKRELGSHLHI